MPQKCFYPGGNVLEWMAPCDPDAQTSSCCAGGDACLENGLCYSVAYLFLYRGACTDSLFPPEFCSAHCVASDEPLFKSSNLNDLQALTACGDFHSRTFTCSSVASDCLIANFTLSPTNFTAWRPGSLVNASNSDAATINSTVMSIATTMTTDTEKATATTSACPVSKTQNKGVSSTVLGIAVAVPAVVLLLVALIGLLFCLREHKKRVKAEKSAESQIREVGQPQKPSPLTAQPVVQLQSPKPSVVEIGRNSLSRTYEMPTIPR